MLNVYSVFLFVAVILASGYAADEEYQEHVPVVTGGTNALWGQFPAAVSLDSPYNLHCGGVVVDRRHILTSAQCVLNATHQLINPFWLTAVAGDINLAPRSIRRETRNITHIYVHPSYNPHTRMNDIAVLRVDEPYNFPLNTVEQAIRSSRIVRDGLQCQLVGWGSIAVAATSPLVVNQRVLNQNVLNRDACNVETAHRGRVLESMVCAGSITATNPVSGPCNGNLGSGLFCEGQLVGILSFGINCGVANNPGVYTQVRFHNNWIQQQFNRTDSLPIGWSPVPQP